jgi:hypothetical protein
MLWRVLKNAVYTSKPRTMQDLRREIESECSAVPLATSRTSASPLHVVVYNALLPVADILNICDFKCENVTIISLFLCELWTFKVCVCFRDTLCIVLSFHSKLRNIFSLHIVVNEPMMRRQTVQGRSNCRKSRPKVFPTVLKQIDVDKCWQIQFPWPPL